MTPRPLTLLELAIAASAAVVPILLVVLLVVAWPGANDAAPSRGDERHVSVRHLAALKTFEHAIVRRDAVHVPAPSAGTLLARVPQCSAEWTATRGLLARLRATLSPSGRDEDAGPAAHIAGQLAGIDRALLRFSGAENRRVTHAVGLDGDRWLDAVVATLQAPAVSPDHPGREFAVRCDDIALAVRSLARSDGRMLAALAWRGTETERSLAHWRADQVVEVSSRLVARANPWAGLPGCIYLGGTGAASSRHFVAGARGLDEALCRRPDMIGSDDASAGVARIAGEPTPELAVDDPRWKVPPSLAAMLQPLDALHRPGSALYRAYTRSAVADASASGARGPNRIDLGGSPVDVGFSIDLAIDPQVQQLAQRTAACYTGRDDVCRALGIRRRDDASRPLGHAMLEQAMVRMAAVAVIDVATGRIEALAGALSPCTRQEHDGPGRSARCDRRLPYPIRYRPDALLNPAVFHDAMPASTIKPIMAAAFLSDQTIGARWLAAERAEIARTGDAAPSAQSLRGQLVRSDSARFLDRMFCADRDFAGCARPWSIQAMAATFGWNGGCASPTEGCGKRDLLFGAPGDGRLDGGINAFALDVSYGRLLAEPSEGATAGAFRLRPPAALDLDRMRRCAAGPDGRRMSPDDWEKCRGGTVVDVVAEGWGQGHARASALGGAGMMALLAAAANGQSDVRGPHLVTAVRGVRKPGRAAGDATVIGANAIAAEPHGLAREPAEVILNGLSFGHRVGTSRRACEQVFAAADCATMDWIAGKTGTPTFPNDDRSLDELARLCASDVPRTKAERAACGPLRPYKWYVAAYRTDPADPRWTKAIGVLTERNWLAESGRIHGAGDRGPNPAAEIALQIAGRHAGLIAEGRP